MGWERLFVFPAFFAPFHTEMLPGVGIFGTGNVTKVLVPLLREKGFHIEAIWGRTNREAEEVGVPIAIVLIAFPEILVGFSGRSGAPDSLLHQQNRRCTTPEDCTFGVYCVSATPSFRNQRQNIGHWETFGMRK